MVLSNLPRDVLLIIGRLMPPSDLVAMSLVSRILRDLAQPLLYSSIHITWAPNRHPPITQLLRSFIERPILAHCVQNLRLDGSGFVSRNGRITELDVFLDAVALITDKLHVSNMFTGVPSDTARAWDDAIQKGNIDAVVALLVSLLPNLRRLHLSELWTWECKFLGKLLETSLSNRCGKKTQGHGQKNGTPRLPTFDSLHHVTLSPRLDPGGHPDQDDTKAALALFYLPSIQDLSVSLDSPSDLSWPLQPRPNPLALTSLKIHTLHERHLGSVLSVLQNLKKLRYNWSCQQGVDKRDSNKVVGLDAMATAIARCQKLEALEITAACNPAVSHVGHEPPSLQLQGSLEHLSKLHKLKRMEVPWVFIMGMEESSTPDAGRRISSILPPNTERLLVTGHLGSSDEYEWDETSIIESFAVALASGLKAKIRGLTNVCLPYPVYQSGLSPDCQAKLAGLHAKYKVKFTNQS